MIPFMPFVMKPEEKLGGDITQYAERILPPPEQVTWYIMSKLSRITGCVEIAPHHVPFVKNPTLLEEVLVVPGIDPIAAVQHIHAVRVLVGKENEGMVAIVSYLLSIWYRDESLHNVAREQNKKIILPE